MRFRHLLYGLAAAWTGLFAWNPTAATFGLIPPAEFVNHTESMPLGRYVHDHAGPAMPGEVVVIKHARQFGYPVDNLIKRTVGTAGGVFCWRPDLGTHTLDGTPMPPPLADDIERGIPVWKGCRKIAEDEIVGYGDHPSSFDSRHIGPIAMGLIWGVYRLAR